MQFNSYSYLLLLIVAVAGFWWLPIRFRRSYVLALSILFYATWNIYFVAVPLVICGITYASARTMRSRPDTARVALPAAVASIILILGFFKYRGFVYEVFCQVVPWLGPHTVPAILAVGLPLGV